jgi:hypothetical protein
MQDIDTSFKDFVTAIDLCIPRVLFALYWTDKQQQVIQICRYYGEKHTFNDLAFNCSHGKTWEVFN